MVVPPPRVREWKPSPAQQVRAMNEQIRISFEEARAFAREHGLTLDWELDAEGVPVLVFSNREAGLLGGRAYLRKR